MSSSHINIAIDGTFRLQSRLRFQDDVDFSVEHPRELAVLVLPSDVPPPA